MLYIISGASRAGKTMITKKMSVEKRIPYLSIDWIMMGFTNGIPQYGIHDKLFPDDIAARIWSFLKAMLKSMIVSRTNCIIEGEAIMPELIAELLIEYPDELRVSFLGYTNVDINKKAKEIRVYTNEEYDWLADKSDAYVIDHVKNMIIHSKLIEKSCDKQGLPYFDISKNFTKAIKDVTVFMT